MSEMTLPSPQTRNLAQHLLFAYDKWQMKIPQKDGKSYNS